jgi:hypothetical protein
MVPPIVLNMEVINPEKGRMKIHASLQKTLELSKENREFT